MSWRIAKGASVGASQLRRRALAGAMCGAVLVLLATPFAALAQTEYPARPVTLIVPYPAGGANDAIGRLIGQKLGEVMGQPVIVDNKPGAGTTIGAASAAKAAPDGYTMVLGSLASHAVSPHLLPKVGYDPLQDFAPIGLIGIAPTVATVNKESAFTTLASLVDAAKANPGSVNYGSAGNGSPPHLAGELFAQASGASLTHIPYKGGNAHTMDLMGGRLQVIFDTTTGAMPLLKGDKLRALAVASPTRLPELPNVPTFAESGYPNFEVNAWYALYAPAKTPAAVVAKLSNDLGKVMRMPDVTEKLRGLAVRPSYGSAQELAAFTASEYAKYGKVIKTANIKPD